MKRNKLFIAGLVTVFVALCSLTLVSSTWAKYTSTASGSDSARVAYWGFNEASSMDITELFVNSYDSGKVTSKDSKDVIAPGTAGQASFKFDYTSNGSITAPEVAYTISVSTADSSCPADLQNANIQWKLDTGEWGTWAQLLTAIEGLGGSYAANTPAAISSEHTIYWQWKYSVDTAGDVADTKLGNKASLDQVVLKITVTATQVD